MKDRVKLAKILIILILITLISGKLFAHANSLKVPKVRVCISQIHSKEEVSSITGEEGILLEFKSSHAFFTKNGTVFRVDGAQRYLVKSEIEGAGLYLSADGVSGGKPQGFKGVSLYQDGIAKYAISDEVYIDSLGKHFIYDGREYAQDLRFVPAKSGFIAVNHLELEEYLRGVVPAEMPSKWHVEALKAQAVAARTYAYRAMKHNAAKPYDLLSTTADQVYAGVSKHQLETDYAISHTAGEILSYENEPIVSFYSADNGGYTVENKRFPYLKSKLDLFSGTLDSVKWNYYVEFKKLEQALGIPKIKSVVITHLDPSLRVSEITIETVSGSQSITGSKLRSALGYSNVKSTLFTLTDSLSRGIEVLGDLALGVPADPHKSAVESKEYYIIGASEILSTNLKDVHVLSIDETQRLPAVQSVFVQTVAEMSEVLLSEEKKSALMHSPLVDQTKFLASRGDKKITSEAAGIYIKGVGYGHGVGMSQWGANNRAKSGHGYDEILGFYYEGARITKIEE